ncbi:MAG: flagellar basal body P-ring formation protein FlgA, partial [Inquilinus sp.]|nr:flagellar basal body P-ring formation protein FlgA [Inquilinus sp.]
SGRFAAPLVAPADGPAVLRLPLSGRAVGVAAVPVLIRRVRPGEVIGAADIGHVDITSDRLQSDVALDASEMIGMSPRRLLAANAPLRLTDLRPPTLVRRGETVTMLLQTGALALSARGRALDEGAAGDVIRVVNTDSNRTIEAEIRGPGTVVVRIRPALAGLN